MNRISTRCRCGGIARLYRYGVAFWRVECSECGARIEGDSMREAINTWERVVSEDERATDQ